MTEIICSIISSYYEQGAYAKVAAPQDLTEPLVFVPGLTSDEQAFIRDNKSKLGSGKAKQAADFTHAQWGKFRKVPIVFQILAWVLLVVIIATIPFVFMYIGRAVRNMHTYARMTSSMGVAAAVLTMIIGVHTVL